MGIRSEVLKRVEKKKAEVAMLEVKIREAHVYISALEDTLKILPFEDDEPDAVALSAIRELREGSLIFKAKEAIQGAGKPLHVSEILAALARPNDKENRAALSGSISAYVRKNEIFTRPAPNTFGVVELADSPAPKKVNGPPPQFGHVEPSREDYGDEITDEEVPF